MESLRAHYIIIPPNLMNIFDIIHSIVCNELLQILNMLARAKYKYFQGARIWIIKGRNNESIYVKKIMDLANYNKYRTIYYASLIVVR